MHCVVSGAAGFLGAHLCARLLADGAYVVGLDSLLTGQRANAEWLAKQDRFQFVEHDICEPITISSSVDAVFNFACPASPVDFRPLAVDIMRVCSEGTLNMLQLARTHQATFVQASTSECYGDPEVHPQPESYWGHVNCIGPRAPYDEGKRYAEALIMAHHREFGLNTRIGRIFNTYGPRMRVGDGRVLPSFIQQALADEPLTVHGDGTQTRSLCYVTDLIDGFIRLSRDDDPAPCNIGNPDEITILQLAHEVIELTGSKSTVGFCDMPQDDPKRRKPDITRARQRLQWAPTTDRRQGLLATIEYFRTVL